MPRNCGAFFSLHQQKEPMAVFTADAFGASANESGVANNQHARRQYKENIFTL
jgi:hypothetical protein